MLELISVIIPVYNVEKYLPKCIDCIINQTYKNLEIILVDDGSTDNSGKICDEYAAKDNRIKVIHKENGGLSDARNAGIDICKGSYISFVDSDDYIDIKTIEILHKALTETSTDISICNFYFYYEKNNEIIETANKSYSENKIFTSSEAISEMLYQRSFDTSACGKLYKAPLFKSIRYPKGKIYEDLATTYKILYSVNSVVLVPFRLYYYLQRENSIMSEKFSPKKLQLISVSDEILSFVSKNLPECIKAAEYRKLASCFHIYNFLQKNEHRDLRKKMKDSIKPLRRKVLFDKNAVRNIRLSCLLSYFSFDIVPLYKKLKSGLRR